MPFRKPALALAFLAGIAPLAHAQEPFALHDGDRVVFYGDSITDQRRYTSFAETYIVTRFPKLNISFVHSGWGGDRVSGGGGGPIDVRLYRDVLPYNPTVVTIMLGMNDGGYKAFDQKLYDDFTNGYKHILDTLTKSFPNARIVAIQPSAYDDVIKPPSFEGGYNKVLLSYGKFLQDLVASGKYPQLSWADLNNSLSAMLAKANALDATNAAKLIPDRIHPNEQPTLIMAESLLKAWNAPSVVTEVEIDGARKAVTTQSNTHVSDLKSTKGLSWTQLDDALPFPLAMDALTQLVLKSSDFVAALDREPLRVKGLTGGKYALKIDGEMIGSFTPQQLSEGVNLAELATPMSKQATEVHALTLQHLSIHNTRWRSIQVPLQTDETPETLAALKSLDDLEASLVKQQRAAAQPRARRYELIPE